MTIKLSQLRVLIRKRKRIKERQAALSAQLEKIDKVIIAELGVKGTLSFEIYRVTVVQAFTRRVPWKEIAVGLARKLFDHAGFRKWAKALAKKHPKKPCAPFVKATEVKPDA